MLDTCLPERDHLEVATLLLEATSAVDARDLVSANGLTDLV